MGFRKKPYGLYESVSRLQLLALHLEMLGYILGLLKGFKYLLKTDGLIGDTLTLRLLRRTLVLDVPCKSTEDAENKLTGLILTVGDKVRKL